jgi:hypothetical protein
MDIDTFSSILSQSLQNLSLTKPRRKLNKNGGSRTLRHEALFQNASEHSSHTFLCKYFKTEDILGSKVYQKPKYFFRPKLIGAV